MLHDFSKNFFAIATIVLVAGCAAQTAKQDDTFATQDKLESINRPIFTFNLYFDKYFMKPMNTAYDVLPGVVRTGIDNFFTNLSEPLNVVEGALQANPDIAFTSVSRFSMNTIIGVGGLYDYAATQGLYFQDQSGGKTLAAWGVPSGSYLVIPFLGPSTVRGAAGEAADWFIDPMGYVLNTPEEIVQVAGDAITDSDEHRTTINQFYYESLSPYEATRAAFLQHQGLLKNHDIEPFM